MLIYSTFNLIICPQVYNKVDGLGRIFFILAILIILINPFFIIWKLDLMSNRAKILAIVAVIGLFLFFWFLKKYRPCKCPECKSYISKSDHYICGCGCYNSTSIKYCPRCGEELTLKIKFCSTCGHIIEQEDREKKM